METEWKSRKWRGDLARPCRLTRRNKGRSLGPQVKRSSVERAKEKGSAAGIRRLSRSGVDGTVTVNEKGRFAAVPSIADGGSLATKFFAAPGGRMPVAAARLDPARQYLHLFHDQECGVGRRVTVIKHHAGVTCYFGVLS